MKVRYIKEEKEFKPREIILEYEADLLDLRRVLNKAIETNVEYNFAQSLYDKLGNPDEPKK